MIEIPENTDFPIENLPFGIFSYKNHPKRIGVAIGDYAIDLYAFNKLVPIPGLKQSILINDYLNDFIALGKNITNNVRATLQDFLKNNSHTAWASISKFLVPMSQITLHLPIKIGDYTDFYSSEQHARNVGMMFRDPENALMPNWKHLPVAYHGRSSSICVSGTNFHRPKGQLNKTDQDQPIFSSSVRLDFELEMATVIGKATNLGDSISVNQAEEYVFGFLLFNDWSARDIQRWEYVPLGPFLSKNFFSAVSPWVVTTEALEKFKTPAKLQEPKVLDYLNQKERYNYDIQLEVYLETLSGATSLICQSNFKNLFWTVNQQIAHHTVNGCNLNIGDLMASGTISGDVKGSFGSMLEISWGGKNPITLTNGEIRSFVEDGDTIIIKGFAVKNGLKIGFGEVKSMVLPAK